MHNMQVDYSEVEFYAVLRAMAEARCAEKFKDLTDGELAQRRTAMKRDGFRAVYSTPFAELADNPDFVEFFELTTEIMRRRRLPFTPTSAGGWFTVTGRFTSACPRDQFPSGEVRGG